VPANTVLFGTRPYCAPCLITYLFNYLLARSLARSLPGADSFL